MEFLFSSESVSNGHPDKIADQLSDAILDECILQDKQSKVAAETLVSTGLVVLAGEISTNAKLNYQKIVRNTIRNIGYKNDCDGFSADSCAVLVNYDEQSSDIAAGIKNGAGDQGLMFGYACNETKSFMPLPIYYSHRIMEQHAKVRNTVSWLGNDAKVQLTVRYDSKHGNPISFDTVVLSSQHKDKIEYQAMRLEIIEKIILPILPESMLINTKYIINPAGKFIIGGPKADAGLTGRKISVDTYGGSAPHGGGAFSGKDPSKVDRSAAYMARYIAKNIVASGIARQCQIQLAYAIGIEQPVSVNVYTFGTGLRSDFELQEIINQNFDLSPQGIISKLDLLRPIYQKTAVYGHFGRDDIDFTWENLDKQHLFC